MPSVVIHGVYKVRAPQPCFIVEITIHDSETELKFSQVVYNVKIGGRKTEQVPFEEHFLSEDGETVLGDYTYGWDNPDAWVGEVRLAFLMHFLKAGETIETPYGPLTIPEPTKRPERLKSIKYVSPY
jgi:hypothetical protein